MCDLSMNLQDYQQEDRTNAKSRAYGEYLASQEFIILAGFYNPLTATGGLGTVMKIIGSTFRMLKVVCIEPFVNDATSYMSGNHEVHPLDVDETIVNNFHRMVCKGHLWASLHEEEVESKQLNQKAIDSIYEFSYRYVEHLIRVIDTCPVEPIIWFNDYAMIPVLKELRSRKVKIDRIGISIRSSFGVTHAPKFDPSLKPIIQEGLLSANFISFHRQRDVYHFLEFIEEFPGAEISWERLIVETQARTVVPRAVPMGSSRKYWLSAGKSQEAEGVLQSVRNRFSNEIIILSVSRLEPHKAIGFELDVIERLVKYYPCFRGQFRFLRIMPVFQEYKKIPTYASLKNEIEQRVLRINGSYGSPGWQPVELISGSSFHHNTLAGYYRASGIIMVLSHADGFNHVSVEAVLAKQEKDPPLTLLLSDTGSSDYLNDAFVKASSKSPTEVALKIAQVLTSGDNWRHNLHKFYLKAASARTSLDWTYEVLGGIGGASEV